MIFFQLLEITCNFYKILVIFRYDFGLGFLRKCWRLFRVVCRSEQRIRVKQEDHKFMSILLKIYPK